MIKQKEYILYIITCSEDNLEKSTHAFKVACSGIDNNIETIIILQGEGVWLAKKGKTDNLKEEGMEPIKTFIDKYLVDDNQLHVCGTCLKKRNISEDELISGAVKTTAAKISEMIFSARNVVTY